MDWQGPRCFDNIGEQMCRPLEYFTDCEKWDSPVGVEEY
jgi:hypothetical protein